MTPMWRQGARILPAIEDVYGIAEMIVKVKEPIASEYPLVRKGQLVFTYFHFASDECFHPCHDKERLHLSGFTLGAGTRGGA